MTKKKHLYAEHFALIKAKMIEFLDTKFLSCTDIKKRSIFLTHYYNLYFLFNNKMAHTGLISPVAFPSSNNYDTVVLFFAPSYETNVAEPSNAIDWNAFKLRANDNYVKTFQQLQTAFSNLPIAVSFDELVLIDIFPNLIWYSDMEIADSDYDNAISWLTNQLSVLNPKRLFIANKTQGKVLCQRAKFKDMLKTLNLEAKLICHPGYTNYKPQLVIQEWADVFGVEIPNIEEEDSVQELSIQIGELQLNEKQEEE